MRVPTCPLQEATGLFVFVFEKLNETKPTKRKGFGFSQANGNFCSWSKMPTKYDIRVVFSNVKSVEDAHGFFHHRHEGVTH